MTSWAANLTRRDQSFAVLVRIEGVGEYAGQWTFCTSVPAYGDSLFKPWLKTPPSILREQADLFGGVPAGEASGGCTVELVDVGDALTALLRTDRGAYTVLTSQMAPAATSAIVGLATGIATNDVVWVGSEALRVTGKAGSTLTVTRGWLDTEVLEHEADSPVHLSTPYLEGRRISVYVVPLDGSSSDEQLVGTYVLESLSWSEDGNDWLLRGVSQLRYLERHVPLSPRTGEVLSEAPVGAEEPAGMILTAQSAIEGLWTGEPFHVQLDSEILQLDYRATSPVSGAIFYDIAERRVFGSKQRDFKAGDQITQVFLAGRDVKVSPGPSPSTSRSSGTWNAVDHWVDLLLVVLLSSADDVDGLELTNYGTSGTDWARSNFSSLPPGYGVGLPASLVDWTSWEDVRNRTSGYRFPYVVIGGDPMSFVEWVTEQFLVPLGVFITLESGLVKAVLPRVPAASSSPSVSLGTDEILVQRGDRGTYVPRVKPRREKAEAVGAIIYEVGPQRLEASYSSKDFGLTYGQRGFYGQVEQAKRIPVPGGDPTTPELYGRRAVARLFRKHRPPLSYELDASMEAFEAAAGDVIGLTLPGYPNMQATTRGLTVAFVEVEGKEVVFSRRDGAHVKLSVRTYGRAKVGLVAPSAYVASVIANDATVSANRFTETDAATSGLPVTDAAAFSVGDRVKLIDLDGAEADGGYQTITGISGNVISLDGNFGANLAPGTVLTYADVGDTTSGQRASFVHCADRANQTVGATSDAPWIYGEP